MIRTPKFWYSRPGFLAWTLFPLGWLYAKATAWRINKSKIISPESCPVICIGNIHAGGTGKTPTTIAFVEHLQSLKHVVVVVSRGYGGTIRDPVEVEPATHNANLVGDEPLLLAAFCKVVVANDRAEGISLALKSKPDVILLDDGFQDPSIHKDFSMIVVDANHGFGNGFCIPAGPLREPFINGMNRADMCLSIGSEIAQKKFLQKLKAPLNVEHVTAEIKPLLSGMDWKGLRVFAFAGMADPEKFFITLQTLGVNILGTEVLSDHQPLSPRLMKRLSAKAKSLDAQLVCTEKDSVRLPESYRRDVLALPVRLKIQDWTKIDQKLVNIGLK